MHPELIWAAGVIIGGYLLLPIHNLTTKGKVGVWIIFASFIFQVYWVITNPWVSQESLIQVIIVTVILIVGLLYMWVKQKPKKGNG